MENSTPMKLDALSVRVDRLEERIADMGESLMENTAITRTIAEHTGTLVDMVRTYTDAATTVKTLSTAGKLTAGIIGGITAVGAAIAAGWHLFFPAVSK